MSDNLKQRVRTRFAPSPTGYMHIGNLRTALYAYLYAKKEQGDFILRIEDTDQKRFVADAVDFIKRTLAAAHITADEGPDIGGPVGPYVQSERKAMYLPYAEQLVREGKAYYCFCTKEELDERRAAAAARGETFKYDKHCLHMSREEVERRLAAGHPAERARDRRGVVRRCDLRPYRRGLRRAGRYDPHQGGRHADL